MDSTSLSTNYDALITNMQTSYDNAIKYQKNLSEMTTKFEADQSAITIQNSLAKGLSRLVTNLSRNTTG